MSCEVIEETPTDREVIRPPSDFELQRRISHNSASADSPLAVVQSINAARTFETDLSATLRQADEDIDAGLALSAEEALRLLSNKEALGLFQHLIETLRQANRDLDAGRPRELGEFLDSLEP